MVGLSCLGGVVDGSIGRSLPAVLVIAELRVVLLPYIIHWIPPCCSEIGLSDPPSLSAKSIIHVVIGALSYKLMLGSVFEDFLIIKGLHLIVCLEVVGLAYTSRRALVISDWVIPAEGIEAISTAIEVFLKTRVIGGELMGESVFALSASLPVFFCQLPLQLTQLCLFLAKIRYLSSKILFGYEELMLTLVVLLLGGL